MVDQRKAEHMTDKTWFQLNDAFGELLRETRLAAGLSQSELSQRSGLPKPTLSRYENGHVLPSLNTLRQLAEALGVGEWALLPGCSPEREFYDALRKHGIEIRSSLEAQKLADVVRRVVEGEDGEEIGLRRRSKVS